MVDLAATVWRDYATAGVPGSGVNQPAKRDIRAWGTYLETMVSGAQVGGAVTFQTLAAANANLNYVANQTAWVVLDTTAANNGIYQKQGASGSGSWLRVGDLPYSFIRAVGGGTANAIVATTTIPIPASDGGALIVLPITTTNTATPVTVTFNGGAPLQIKTASGANVPIGGLVNGMLVEGFKAGSTFQLVSDIASAAIQTAAEAAQAAAEAAAASATGAAPVANRTVMQALDTSSKKTAVIYSEGGRNGLFVWDSSDLSAMVTLDTEQGVYVPPTSDTTGASGCWVRNYAPYRIPNVRAFGAKLDGTTNDSAAIMGALAVLGEAFIPWTVTGFVAGNVTLGTAQKIIGERKPVWKILSSASYGVRCTAYMSENGTALNQYAYLQGIVFDGSAVGDTIPALLMGTGDRVVYGLRVFNVDYKKCGAAYLEETHASNYVVDIQLTDCTCTQTRGRQVYSKRSRGFFTFRDFRIDHGQNTSQVTWEGARFEDMVGLELEKFDVVGPIDALVPTHTYQPTSIGIVLSGATGSASVWLTRVLVDSTRGPAILINNIFGVYGNFVQVYQNLGQGIDLENVSKSIFTNTRVEGAKDVSGAAASAAGVYMASCQDVIFDAFEIADCTGSGNVMVSCQDCKMTNGSSKLNTSYGFAEVTAATRNLRSGVTSAGNGVGSLLQIGAQSATANWWPNSGTFTSSTVGSSTV